MKKRITALVKTNARNEDIEHREENMYVIRVKARPLKNQANRALQKLVAQHFGVPRSSVCIVRGARASRKIVDIATE